MSTTMHSSSFPAVAAMAHLPVHPQNISKGRASFLNPHRPSLLDPTLGNAPRSSVCSKKPYSSSLSSSSSLLVVAAVKGAAKMQNQEQKSTHVWKDVKVGSKWREIQGEKDWEGLLGDPLDRTLRAELIRYGEFAEVTYDAFDFDPQSIYCGSCKYSRRTLFRNVNKKDCGYEVKKYLYATSNIELPRFFKKSDRPEEHRWSGDSNWMGYIAVSTDEDEIKRLGRRDIVIAWRGTCRPVCQAEPGRSQQAVIVPRPELWGDAHQAGVIERAGAGDDRLCGLYRELHYHCMCV